MYKVEQKADNLKDGITNMMLGAKNDYINMSTEQYLFLLTYLFD